MTELFRNLDMTSRESGERRDCTVKAWAVVAGITYTEAHCDLAAVGRKRGRGVHMQSLLTRLCDMQDKRFTDVTDEWKRKGARTMLTVGRVLPKRGAFLVFCRGHVAAFRGGELHDWTKGRRHRVIAIYRVNALPKEAAPVKRSAVFNTTLQLWETPGGGIVNWRNV